MTKTALKHLNYDIQPRRALRRKNTGGRPKQGPKGWSPHDVGDTVVGREILKITVRSTAKKKYRYDVEYIACKHRANMSHAAIQTAIRDRKPGRTDQGYCPECLKLKKVKLLLTVTEKKAFTTIPVIRTRRPPSDPGGHWSGWMDR